MLEFEVRTPMEHPPKISIATNTIHCIKHIKIVPALSVCVYVCVCVFESAIEGLTFHPQKISTIHTQNSIFIAEQTDLGEETSLICISICSPMPNQ